MKDPMEAMIERALRKAGVKFTRENRIAGRPQRDDDITLDFHLTDLDIYIEVKRFYTDRIDRQISKAPNVIVAQGEGAVRALAQMIGTWQACE